MKNGRLLLGLVGLSALSVALMANRGVEPQYTPRSVVSYEAIDGAAAYLHSLKANIITGEVSPADEQQARRQISALSNKATLNLQWESLGPANAGGRSRALLIDRDSSNILYAGSVSGGLYRSRTGGSSWKPVSPEGSNLAVVSICQAANGDIYYGTGEYQFIGYSGNGASSTPAFVGGGVYKSTDNGRTFSVLPSTVPNGVTTSADWSAVGDMVADPTDPNVIYAATNSGFMRSTDGGSSWTTSLAGSARDVTMDINGNIYLENANRLMFSSTGMAGDWTELSAANPSGTQLPRSNGRLRVAVSPQDPNYIYVAQLNGDALKGVYRSTDGGSTWMNVGNSGRIFDPMCSGGRCQGTYDFLFQVSAKDKNRFWLGGITLWTWQNFQWSQVNSSNDFPGNVFYVHSDLHELIIDPRNPDILWVASDGGLFKSGDHGVTWSERNLEFRTLQFYKFGIGEDRALIGGTQDNGTQVLDGRENFSNYSTRVTINGTQADGGEADKSWLLPKALFGENQNGDLGRSENNGQSFSSFYSVFMTNGFRPFQSQFSNWIMPYHLHETISDDFSNDSVLFHAYPATQSLGFGNGSQTEYSNTLARPYAPAEFLTSSFIISSGGDTVVSDGAGNLSGDGTGTFNSSTGEYEVTFSTAPLAEILVSCNVRYPAGAVVTVGSLIGGLPYNHTLQASVEPGDSLMIQDRVQAMMIVGLSSWEQNNRKTGGIWMTREVLNFSGTPEWWKIGHMNNGETPLSMDVSADGDVCYIGTTAGRLYRYSNLLAARNADADIYDDTTGQPTIVSQDMIRSFGRGVTSVSIDPNDNDRVLVTLGNYGANDYVYFSNNATSGSPTFVSKQGALARMPVYSCTFDKADPSIVILGTEFGIYATDNINSPSPLWTNENNGIPMVPVFEIEQYRTNKLSPSASESVEEGDIFVATHGRGFYRTSTLMTTRPISVEENEVVENSRSESLNVFPNPTSGITHIRFELDSRTDVSAIVLDLNGRRVRTVNFGMMAAGEHDVDLSLDGLSNGVYMVALQTGNKVQTGKVVLRR